MTTILVLPALAIGYIVAAGIAAGAGIYGSWRNRKLQEKQNALDRQRADDMAKQDREWNLEDWNMINAYNHPMEQMNRLRQAGLNPHLVYGKGADQAAAMIRGVDRQNIKQEAPQMDYAPLQNIPNAIMQYQNIKATQAQTDNIAAMAETQKTENLLKQAQIGKTIADTAYTKTQHEQATRVMDSIVRKYELENTSIEQNIAQSQAYVKQMGDQNQREWEKQNLNLTNLAQDIAKKRVEILQIQANTAKTAQELEKITSEIQAIELQIETGQVNKRILEIQRDMWEKGISPSDPIYWRMGSAMLDKFMGVSEYGNEQFNPSAETREIWENWKKNRYGRPPYK